MKPETPDNHPDLFCSQLSQILKMSHPLYRLADQINWSRIEDKIDVVYSTGYGHPALPTRLLAGLHYLKYTFNESVVERWVEILIGNIFAVTSSYSMNCLCIPPPP